jgi:Di- and tricarboxylate transporters
MTTQMIIALVIVILMIGMIMSDKFAFGAPPLVAGVLMVLTGIAPIKDVFAGFIDPNVVMIAGFLAVMAGLQKTRFMGQIQSVMSNLASKGGFKAYVLLLLVVMLGASLMSGTGYYVMVLTIAAAIPYNKGLPNSKLVMPLGFATSRALVPVSVAFFVGMANSLLQSGKFDGTVPMAQFSLMSLFMSVGFLIWALIAYRILPDHDVNKDSVVENKKTVEVAVLPLWKEVVTYIVFTVSVIGMMFATKLGEVAYILPAAGTAVLCFIKVFDFKEARQNLFSPLVIMMASVIGVANALANTGFTKMVGDNIASSMGSNINPFILVFVFCLLTSACATITGASIGSLFIFAPIGIATCMSLGLNPTALAAAITVSAWGGGFLPIDGLPAMVLGMGKYKLSQFFKFTIPMYFFQLIALTIGAVLLFPM